MTFRGSSLARLGRVLVRVARDRRAVSAVEFALLLPVMLTLFIAGNELSQALTIYRKVSHTGSALGDLVSQVGTIATADMTNILAAATAIMTPYDASGVQLVVSAVNYTTTSGFKTAWSVGQNTSAWTVGSAPPITIPSGLVSNDQQLIVTRVQYTYTSTFSVFMQNILGGTSITLSDVAYLRPRVTDKIQYPYPS